MTSSLDLPKAPYIATAGTPSWGQMQWNPTLAQSTHNKVQSTQATNLLSQYRNGSKCQHQQ